MQRVAIIDSNGLFVEDAIIQKDTELTGNMITTPCPEGFNRPKWDGSKWIEGGTAPEMPVKVKIADLKRKLADTDYAIIKIAEGAATTEEYADLINQRQAWREEINQLGG